MATFGTMFGIRNWSRGAVFSGILLFGLLAMTARPATDPDLWWHLRTGQWIAETGHVPHSDPFSFTRAGHPWVSHEWLSEVVFYQLWKHGGAAALIVFSAIVTAAGFMLLYLRCLSRGVKEHWAAAAIVLGALASAPSWGVRPQMFTFTFASLLLWLVDRGEEQTRLLFWIPPLFLLWLNLHAGFALAPVLMIAYGVGLMLETAFGTTPWREARPIIVRLLLLLLVCAALVPLNPSGAQLYRYPLETLRSSGMRSFIGEWSSPDFHAGLYRPLLLVWLLLLIALGNYRSRSTLKGRVIVPLLLVSLAALDAVRHIPIFVLLAIPVVVGALPKAGDGSVADRIKSPIFLRLQPLFNVFIVILVGVFAVGRWVSLAHSQEVREAELYPQKAVAMLRANDPDQDQDRRIFAYYDWGGYAIWRLYPEYRVFVDGRADLYVDKPGIGEPGVGGYGDDIDILGQFKAAVQVRTGWREVLDGWKVDVVLVPPSCALAQALLLDPNWQVEFSDSKAVMLRRSGFRH